MVTDSRWNERIFEKKITDFYIKFQEGAPFVLTVKKAWIEVRLKVEIVYFSEKIELFFQAVFLWTLGPKISKNVKNLKKFYTIF